MAEKPGTDGPGCNRKTDPERGPNPQHKSPKTFLPRARRLERGTSCSQVHCLDRWAILAGLLRLFFCVPETDRQDPKTRPIKESRKETKKGQLLTMDQAVSFGNRARRRAGRDPPKSDPPEPGTPHTGKPFACACSEILEMPL